MNRAMMLPTTATTGPRPVVILDSSGPTRNILSGGQQVSGAFTSTSSSPGEAAIVRHVPVATATGAAATWVFRQYLMAPPSATATFHAQVRTQSSPTWQPITFGGASSADIPSTDGQLVSDALPVRLIAGEWVDFMTHLLTDTPGSSFAVSQSGASNVFPGEGGASESWATAQTASSLPTTTGSPALRPSAIFAPSPIPSWVVCGDSIMSLPDSWGHRAMRLTQLPSMQCSNPGEAFSHFPARWNARMATAFTQGATKVLCQYGTNDTSGAVPQMQASTIAFWTQCRNAGADTIIQSTITPASSSTDNWATLTNQTPIRTNRVPFNQWLRDGAPIVNGSAVAVGTANALRAGASGHPLTSVIDMAAAVESSQDSGMWRTDLGSIAGDGLHPSPLGCQILGNYAAAALPTD